MLGKIDPSGTNFQIVLENKLILLKTPRPFSLALLFKASKIPIPLSTLFGCSLMIRKHPVHTLRNLFPTFDLLKYKKLL
jgi:hypothetical protein